MSFIQALFLLCDYYTAWKWNKDIDYEDIERAFKIVVEFYDSNIRNHKLFY